MSDGAHQGVTPNRALQTILGGDPAPSDDEGMTRQQMRDAIHAVDVSAEPRSYDQCAMQAARMIYDFITEDPLTRRLLPTETVYDRESPDYNRWLQGKADAPIKERGLYDVMKDNGIDLAALGLTGFQWGWAVNAARYALGELPVPNPAIIEVAT